LSIRAANLCLNTSPQKAREYANRAFCCPTFSNSYCNIEINYIDTTVSRVTNTHRQRNNHKSFLTGMALCQLNPIHNLN